MEWLDRFVVIMDCISASAAGGVSITELTQTTGLSKGSLHRILQDMVVHNLISKDSDTKKYCLGTKSMVWGSRFVSVQDPAGLLSHYCDLLAEHTGLYTFLCRINDDEVYCIYTKQPSGVNKKYFVHVGQRMPIHCTAAAKAIIAFLPQPQLDSLLHENRMSPFTAHTKTDLAQVANELQAVRETKVAFCREELENGVSGVSAPVFVAAGKAAFSISLLGDAAYISKQEDALVRELLQIGREASEQMKSVYLLTSVKSAGV